MKKWVLNFFLFSFSQIGYALPVGNPSEATLLYDGVFWEGSNCIDFCEYFCDPCAIWSDIISVRMGYYGDFVLNRNMRIDEDNNDDIIEHTKLCTNAGYLVLNFCDRLDIFGTLGVTNFCLNTNAFSFGSLFEGSRLTIESRSHFSWSLGGRFTLVDCGCTTLGFEGQYFEMHPHVKSITRSDSVSLYPDSDSRHMKYYEWQVGLGISHRIYRLVPYAAIKWSKAHTKFNHHLAILAPEDAVNLWNLESDKSLGYVIGASLIGCEKTAVTVEGRWGDEKAFYVNGQFRF